MIGEFVPARVRGEPILLVGWDLEREIALFARPGGELETCDLRGVSIDWHLDESDGRWKPDFDEG